MGRILTIDDDRVVRAVLAATLSEAGHAVLEADTGDAGLELARAERPDLILLDIGLPGVHGTKVLDELKRDPDLSLIPVIMVSAFAEAPTVALAKRHGAFDLIGKPFSAETLLDRVTAALGAAPP